MKKIWVLALLSLVGIGLQGGKSKKSPKKTPATQGGGNQASQQNQDNSAYGKGLSYLIHGNEQALEEYHKMGEAFFDVKNKGQVPLYTVVKAFIDDQEDPNKPEIADRKRRAEIFLEKLAEKADDLFAVHLVYKYVTGDISKEFYYAAAMYLHSLNIGALEYIDTHNRKVKLTDTLIGFIHQGNADAANDHVKAVMDRAFELLYGYDCDILVTAALSDVARPQQFWLKPGVQNEEPLRVRLFEDCFKSKVRRDELAEYIDEYKKASYEEFDIYTMQTYDTSKSLGQAWKDSKLDDKDVVLKMISPAVKTDAENELRRRFELVRAGTMDIGAFSAFYKVENFDLDLVYVDPNDLNQGTLGSVLDEAFADKEQWANDMDSHVTVKRSVVDLLRTLGECLSGDDQVFEFARFKRELEAFKKNGRTFDIDTVYVNPTSDTPRQTVAQLLDDTDDIYARMLETLMRDDRSNADAPKHIEVLRDLLVACKSDPATIQGLELWYAEFGQGLDLTGIKINEQTLDTYAASLNNPEISKILGLGDVHELRRLFDDVHHNLNDEAELLKCVGALREFLKDNTFDFDTVRFTEGQNAPTIGHELDVLYARAAGKCKDAFGRLYSSKHVKNKRSIAIPLRKALNVFIKQPDTYKACREALTGRDIDNILFNPRDNDPQEAGKTIAQVIAGRAFTNIYTMMLNASVGDVSIKHTYLSDLITMVDSGQKFNNEQLAKAQDIATFYQEFKVDLDLKQIKMDPSNPNSPTIDAYLDTCNNPDILGVFGRRNDEVLRSLFTDAINGVDFDAFEKYYIAGTEDVYKIDKDPKDPTKGTLGEYLEKPTRMAKPDVVRVFDFVEPKSEVGKARAALTDLEAQKDKASFEAFRNIYEAGILKRLYDPKDPNSNTIAEVIDGYKADNAIYLKMLSVLVSGQASKEAMLRELVKETEQDVNTAQDLETFYTEFKKDLDLDAIPADSAEPAGQKLAKYIDDLKITRLSAAVGRGPKPNPDTGSNPQKPEQNSWFTRKNIVIATCAAAGMVYGYKKWSSNRSQNAVPAQAA